MFFKFWKNKNYDNDVGLGANDKGYAIITKFNIFQKTYNRFLVLSAQKA